MSTQPQSTSLSGKSARDAGVARALSPDQQATIARAAELIVAAAGGRMLAGVSYPG